MHPSIPEVVVDNENDKPVGQENIRNKCNVIAKKGILIFKYYLGARSTLDKKSKNRSQYSRANNNSRSKAPLLTMRNTALGTTRDSNTKRKGATSSIGKNTRLDIKKKNGVLSPNINDRMSNFISNKEKKIKEKREIVECNAGKECTFSPKTNCEANNTTHRTARGFFEDQIKYIAKIQQKVEEERGIKETITIQKTYPKPIICQKSNEIFNKNIANITENKKVHQRLYCHSQERIERQKKSTMTSESVDIKIRDSTSSFYRSKTPTHNPLIFGFAPKILEKSKAIKRNQDVGTILYSEQERRDRKMELKNQEALVHVREEAQGNHILKQSENCLRWKFLEQFESAWSKVNPIENSEKLASFLESIGMIKSNVDLALNERMWGLLIKEISPPVQKEALKDLLLEILGLLTPSHNEINMNTIKEIRSIFCPFCINYSNSQKGDKKIETKETFTPMINENSKLIMSCKRGKTPEMGALSHYDQLLSKGREYGKKRNDREIKISKGETRACTFRPKINDSTRSHDESKFLHSIHTFLASKRDLTSTEHCISTSSFAATDRYAYFFCILYRSLNKVAEKYKEEDQKKRESEIEKECTFKPKINQNSRKVSSLFLANYS